VSEHVGYHRDWVSFAVCAELTHIQGWGSIIGIYARAACDLRRKKSDASRTLALRFLQPGACTHCCFGPVANTKDSHQGRNVNLGRRLGNAECSRDFFV
jgi:hypothetical protein